MWVRQGSGAARRGHHHHGARYSGCCRCTVRASGGRRRVGTGQDRRRHESISPIETKAFAARINDLGCDYLDAPVSRGEVGAKAGSLTIMVGGEETVFERIKPLFELMGKNITLVGDHGAGQSCKIANQIIVALTIEAVGEALLFAAKAGVDPARVRQALMGGAGSRILEVHGERMIKRAFDAGFRIRLHQKDLDLTLAGARALHITLPNTSTTQELFNACAANEWADGVTPLYIASQDGHSDIVKQLLAANADNAANKNGVTPLQIASRKHRRECLLGDQSARACQYQQP